MDTTDTKLTTETRIALFRRKEIRRTVHNDPPQT